MDILDPSPDMYGYNAMKPAAHATFWEWYNWKLEAILKIFEVWHFDSVEQYHPTKNPDGGLFTRYVNTFMKMKSTIERTFH
uniref:Uncharacterized protein n=1 Tax=Romanomermis culicivorax TaxID=13658 RepID=A0A915JE73_ROMCU